MNGHSVFQRPLRGRGDSIFTHHGDARRQQRAIPPFVVDALIDYGEERFLGDGCRSYSFSKRSWKRFRSYMGQAAKAYEKYRGAYLIVGDDGAVVTVAWRH